MKFSSRAALVCAVYFILHFAAQSSARAFEIAPGISVWYPPCGLAVSLLLLLGVRYAWVVLVANIAAAFAVPSLPYWWMPWLFPALITANYAGVAVLARRFLGPDLIPRTLAGTLRFAALVLFAPAPLAAIGTLIVSRFTAYPPPSFLDATLQWWLGDFSGLLTVVPVAVVFLVPWIARRPHPLQHWRWNARFLVSVFGIAAALVASLWFVFSQRRVVPYGTLYICFLPLAWASLRHGLPGATLATLALAMGSLIGMHHSPHADSYWLSFALFEVAVSVLGFGLGSAVNRRNEALAALSTARARMDRVIAGAQLGLWDWDLEHGHVVYNEHCAHLLNGKPEDLGNRADVWAEAIHAIDRGRAEAAFRAHLDGKAPLYECEYRIRTRDGRWRWIHSRGSIVERDADGRPHLVSGTHADVTPRKLAEGAAQRLLSIVETTTDFVLTIDAHGRIVYANSALLQLLETPDAHQLLGQTLFSVFPVATAERLQTEAIPTTFAKGSWQGELQLADSRQRPLSASFVSLVHRGTEDEGTLLSFVMRDVSAQKKAEAANLERERRILQVQRAESLGVLAGGVAHDFNNLLTAVMGNAALLRELHPHLDEPNGPVSQIELAATRAAELCRNLLAYAGRVRLTLTEVDVNQLVAESRELIHAAINKKIQLETELAPDVPRITACASQLQQIVINLALNAQDAIGDRPGKITLRTDSRMIDANDARALLDAPALPPGRYVLLEVSDTGCGIPEAVREQIFEPFFTTKPKGHGLGLSAVNGIVRAHGGVIHVRSAVGRGSTFRIALPALTAASMPAPAAPRSDAAWQGSGLALIVDDEEVVRLVVARMVERLGFTTIHAQDGVDAVVMFRQRHRELRFVITDLSMPRMNGDEAISEMRRINTGIPIILMSGYPEKLATEHFALASPSALLAKPLRLDVLRKTIAQVLTTAPSGASTPADPGATPNPA